MSDKELPSPEYLRQRLRYEPETGLLYWREYSGFSMRWNARYPGRKAGIVNSQGYLRVGVDYVGYQAHRIIWAMYYGEWPDGEIDHIDGNKINNKIGNLRIVSRVENGRNVALPRDNTSGYIGVSWHKRRKKWTVRIKANGKYHYLGLFANFDEAVMVRKRAEAEHGFHPNHGRAPVAAHSINC